MSNPSAIGAVHSLEHFVFTAPDLAEAQRFFGAFGLDARREGSRLRLHTFGHAHAWGSVVEAPGPKRLQFLSFGVYAADEPVFARRIGERSLALEPHPLGDGRGLWLRGPDALPIHLVVADKVTPSLRSVAQPPAAARGLAAAPARSQVRQVRPRRLSHLLLFTADVPGAVAFYRDLLGLKLSDHAGDGIAFLHGAHGSDHHVIALAKSGGGGLHHTSWDVASFDEVGLGAEQMRASGFGQGWGVGRHVLGSNYFHYVRDPWNSYAEYSFDIDFIPAGLEWQAADNAPEDSFYVWGPEVPGDFVHNWEQAPAG
ncbi:MAG: VOC family protein [Burkholderiales bacterium]|nr:VOC family protein [Burkholderiales bacterium]MDE2397622.1 VOC family protein [Burkholderiales bacterium]MDE2452358.1 VOC family protein [Burkholderiales bacterium]